MKILIGGTPTGTLKHISPATYRQHCGMLTSWADRAKPSHAVKLGASWAMDNFAFVEFHAGKFSEFLKRWEGLPGCLFVVSPDVWSNAAETMRLFDQWREIIKSHGYPVALAAQDGLDGIGFNWSDIDCLFVGGTDQFKASRYVAELVAEANSLGKWTHNGRINGRRRWIMSANIGFRSVDGSGLVIERRRIHEALAVIHNPQPQLCGLGW